VGGTNRGQTSQPANRGQANRGPDGTLPRSTNRGRNVFLRPHSLPARNTREPPKSMTDSPK
jgi:hypothetical protein